MNPITLPRNPIIPGHWGDPEPRIHDGRFYLFPTIDAPFDQQTAFTAFVSDDLVAWSSIGQVLSLADVSWSTRRAAWAPSVVSRYGTMFMYFSSGDGDGIGLGIWNRHTRRFVDPLRRPLICEWPFGAQPIDANVFVDDDAQAYLYFGGHGRCVVVRLKPDMNRLDGDFHLITPPGYVEGPFMFKRAGRYYFMWSEGNWTNDTYRVRYAIANSPFGPFEPLGTVLQSSPSIATGPGHNSVLQLPGTDDWVICYHRRQSGETDQYRRVPCIDRLLFNLDGTIAPVQMT